MFVLFMILLILKLSGALAISWWLVSLPLAIIAFWWMVVFFLAILSKL